MSAKRLLAAAAIALLLAACGDDEIDGGTKASADGSIPGNVYRVTIDGMPCVLWMDKRGAGDSSWAYSGIDCDWREQ